MEKIFNHTLHKKIWQIIADNPLKDKRELMHKHLSKKELIESGEYLCSACEAAEFSFDDVSGRTYSYTDDEDEEIQRCNDYCVENCPLFDISCCDIRSRHAKYCSAQSQGDFNTAKHIAEEIRDMPVKAGWRTK